MKIMLYQAIQDSEKIKFILEMVISKSLQIRKSNKKRCKEKTLN
jgi:hypothetical protein